MSKQFHKMFETWMISSMLVIVLLCPKFVKGQSRIDAVLKISQDSARTLLSKSANTDTLALANYQIAKKLSFSDLDSSVIYYREAITLAEQTGDAELINRMKKSITYPLIDLQLFAEANQSLLECKSFFETYQDGILLHSWYKNMGYLKTEEGNFSEAIVNLAEALELSYQKDNNRLIHGNLNAIGIVYSRLGSLRRALKYYETIIANVEKSGEQSYYTAALVNAANIHSLIGDKEVAKRYYAKAIERRKNTKREKLKMTTWGFRSALAELEGDLDKAIECINSALEMANEADWKAYSVTYLHRLFELHNKNGNRKTANYYLIKAYNLQQTISNVSNREQIYESYANYCNQVGDYEQAYQVLRSLQEVEKTRNVSDVEMRLLDLEVSELQRLRNLELENLTLESEKYKLKLDKERNTKVFLILLMVLLGGLLTMLYRNMKSKKNANERLKLQNQTIQDNLGEKEILLKEIHHRVKNNLQIVSSMLSLQARYVADPKAKEAIKESKDRVKSMALIHQKLYQEDNLKGVNMTNYVEALISSLAYSNKIDSANIKIENNVEDMVLDVDTAIPIGLVVNELITNAIKHAFTDKGGNIWVSLRKNDGKLFLEVKDDGTGILARTESEKQELFGFRMIRSLIAKLKGEMEITNGKGSTIRIAFKKFTEIKQ